MRHQSSKDFCTGVVFDARDHQLRNFQSLTIWPCLIIHCRSIALLELFEELRGSASRRAMLEVENCTTRISTSVLGYLELANPKHHTHILPRSPPCVGLCAFPGPPGAQSHAPHTRRNDACSLCIGRILRILDIQLISKLPYHPALRAAKIKRQ
jgi:hypothetical protein